MSKTDFELGKKVRDHLILRGVETPMIYDQVHLVSSEEKIDALTHLFEQVWKTVGMDLTDDSLCDTPKRMAKMYINEIYQGLNYRNFPKCTAIENKMLQADEMICENRINVQSNCEHHGIVISGHASVAYIPKNKVLGLSKINRVVEFFAKRPQVQERLTVQIYEALSYILGTDDVAVMVTAEHYCVKSRGIRDVGSSTVTSRLGGVFRAPEVRQEFLSLSKMEA